MSSMAVTPGFTDTLPLNAVVDVSQPEQQYSETDEKQKGENARKTLGKEQNALLQIERNTSTMVADDIMHSKRTNTTSRLIKSKLNGWLDLQHCQWKLIFSGFPGRVPITPEMKNALDLGTSTGKLPKHLQGLGVDLSAIQPDSKPLHCRFMTANVEHDWTFETRFDYIHARMLTMGIHDWTHFFKQSWDFLEPGGWIEVNETRFPQFRAAEDDKDGLPEGPFMR
ncbi:hypothetical protein AC578_10943 [Pseudocercospora eumusae]|uniref:Methyltransferase type 11 domain-containing protein n=1 Tax=Pseudocercospora eumusae TaxID=321146 RepID=A0A139HSH9_9PEZI|nr:hypothetical protein AC578_10943 [Pseudocercospora eumusae]